MKWLPITLEKSILELIEQNDVETFLFKINYILNKNYYLYKLKDYELNLNLYTSTI